MTAPVVAWDTETKLIAPALHAPPLVCLTWQEQGGEAQIVHRTEALQTLRGWLATDPTLVGQNVAFDFAVVLDAFPDLRADVFRAYREDRVTDTMIRGRLLDNALGIYGRKIGGRPREYSLEALAKRYVDWQLQKDAWRLSYGEFYDVPLSGWIDRAKEVQAAARAKLAELEKVVIPKKEKAKLKELQKTIDGLREMAGSDPSQCLKYPLDDARATLAVYLAQEKHKSFLDDQYRQARGAFALHLSSVWGLRTDPEGVEILRKETEADLEYVEDALKQIGLVRADGSRDTKAAKALMVATCRKLGFPIPRTDSHEENCPLGKGHKKCDACEEYVSLDSDACEDVKDYCPELGLYAELSTLKKVLTNDVEALSKGVYYPVHTRYGFAATGRTTSSNPNIQNVRRRPGIREAFVPRPGYVFAEADYPQLELYTLAQCCMSWLGRSQLAKALNDGLDPHLWVASILLGISYDEAKKNKKRSDVARARQLAKAANFGFPGGLGVDSFIAFAKSSTPPAAFAEMGLTPALVRDLKKRWFEAWPEMIAYFARINELCEQSDDGRANVETLFTKRFRGKATYCSACNNGFQALGSDCAKNAAWLIAEAEYVNESSPLYNSRTVAFVHDEFIVETPDNDNAHDAAYELARLMVEGANVYLPDVPIPLERMEPLLMRRWSKDAESLFHWETKRLVVWEPALAGVLKMGAAINDFTKKAA